MKRVIYWFIFLFSIQTVAIVIMEALGGAYSVYDPPSLNLLLIIGFISAALLFFSSFKIYNLYKEGRK